MAYQKLQVSDGLLIIPSDEVKIPDPTSFVKEGSDGVFNVGGVFDSASGDFLNAGIKVGAIVYNVTDQKASYVTSINSDSQLGISPSYTGTASSVTYLIFNEPTSGCILYVGGAGIVTASLAAQKDVSATTKTNRNPQSFENVANASFMPIQVVQVWAEGTDATKIIGLW